MNTIRNPDDYQAALAEAANAFMKTMALRGYAVRDYPQNFVAHMAKQARLHFESNPKGASPVADATMAQFLHAQHAPTAGLRPVATVHKKPSAFPLVGQRQAA